MLVVLDMLGEMYRDKTWMISAMIARRKFFAVHARNFMFLGVIVVMHDAIDT
jgi:hypothetical protein